MCKVAFYKGTRSGLAGLYNKFVRSWDRGRYSHCELIFSDGMSASASFMDKGVRFKDIQYDPAKWDIFELKSFDEIEARGWFEEHKGFAYDLSGNIKFATGYIPDDPNKFFCSEAISAALGLPEPWRYSPNTLAAVLRFIENINNVKGLQNRL